MVEQCVTADGVLGQSNYVTRLCTVHVVKVYYIYFPVLRSDLVSRPRKFGRKLLSSCLLQRFDLKWHLLSSCLL